MISGISIIIAIFLSTLVIIGAIYVWVYEKAPIWERIQVFSVGIGIIGGIILSLYG